MVSGGVCEGCRDNTEGVQCETCRLGYYPNPDPDVPFTSPEACMGESDNQTAAQVPIVCRCWAEVCGLVHSLVYGITVADHIMDCLMTAV